MTPLVCIYADQQPAVESTIVPCARCGVDVWRSNDSFSGADLEAWCMACVMAEARSAGGIQAAVRPEERFIVVKNLTEREGLTPEQAEAEVDRTVERLNRALDQ